MQVTETPLPGVLLIQPRVFADQRGFFYESFYGSRYAAAGINKPFVQDNVSRSTKGVLRGLHYQLQQPQGKLVYVTRGTVFDVAVDIRQGSPTFGQWFGCILSDENHYQLYIPEGFAHGFCVLSAEADFFYKCTNYYCPQGEVGIMWNDPMINIDWPIEHPELSAKDLQNKLLSELAPEHLPRYED